MWRLGGLLALLAATTNAQDVPRPTRLRIYEVRTSLRFDEGELQRVNFRYDRSSGIKSDIARSLVDVGLTTDRGFVFEVASSGPTRSTPARSRRYISPHHAFPFQRGEPCARVFLFPPLLPTTTTTTPPVVSPSEAPSFGGPCVSGR